MTGEGSPDPQDDLLRIVADVGAVNIRTGLRPGTGGIRLELSPLQLVRLAQELSKEGIQALGLALHYGQVRADPIRVEVLGWSRNWLIDHGLSKHSAEKAARELRGLGLATVAYGPEGMFGPRLAVIGGERFGWEDTAVEQVRDGRYPKGKPSATDFVPGSGPLASIPGKRVTTPVDNVESSLASIPGKRAEEPVDNTDLPAAGETGGRDQRANGNGPTGPAEAQVSALAHLLGRRADGPATTRTVSKEKESLSTLTWSSGTLARTDLDQLLLSEALGESLRSRHSEAVASLTVAFAGSPARTTAALEFLDIPASSSPEHDLATVVVDLLALTAGDRTETAGTLLPLLRIKGAHLRDMAPDDVLVGLVLTLVAALAADVRQWGAWVKSGLERDEWTSSTALTRTLEVLEAMVTGIPAPAAVTSGGISVGVDGPARSGHTAGYLADLKRAVAGTPFEDPVMFADMLANPKRQEHLLMRYQVAHPDERSTDAS